MVAFRMMKKLRIAINGVASINKMLLIAYSVFVYVLSAVIRFDK